MLWNIVKVFEMVTKNCCSPVITKGSCKVDLMDKYAVLHGGNKNQIIYLAVDY